MTTGEDLSKVGMVSSFYKKRPNNRVVSMPSMKRRRRAPAQGKTVKYARTGISGFGDYYLREGRNMIKTPFANAGSHIGKYFNAPGIGWAAGHLIGRILGSGDYYIGPENLQHNVMLNGKELPKFGSSNGTLCAHREYIQDIVTSATANTFKIDSFALNPGLNTTFPWLATLAQNFEEYRFHGMVFEFKTTSSDALNSTNTALGTVIMATQYNSLSPAFSTKQQMENYEFSQSAKPSLSQMHGVECNPGETPVSELFVRTGAVAGSDIRWYDIGNFCIATTGFQGTSVNIGELWVTYYVELLKPKLGTGGGSVGAAAQSLRVGRQNLSTSTSIDFGAIGVQSSGNIAFSVTATALTLTNLVPGTKYEFTYNWFSSAGSTVTTGPTIALTSGATGFNGYRGSSASVVNINAANTAVSAGVLFSATSTNVVLTITPGTCGTGIGNIDLYLCGLDSTVV